MIKHFYSIKITVSPASRVAHLKTDITLSFKRKNLQQVQHYGLQNVIMET